MLHVKKYLHQNYFYFLEIKPRRGRYGNHEQWQFASTALVLPLGQCLCLIGRKPSPQQTWQWIQSTYFSSYWEGPKPEFPISQMSILFNLRKRILLVPSIFFFRPHYTADWEGKLSKEQDADFLSCLNSNAMAGDTGFSGINRRTRRVRQLLSGLDTTGT